MIRLALIAACVCCAVQAAEKESEWQPAVWNGERALVSTSPRWKAVVSLERGRLVHFGPAGSETNLLFAPSTRDDPAGWGGHRLWLGPQSTWPKNWPPPAAWEHSAAESFSVMNGALRLVMPDAGDGWPRLTRTYRWNGRQLLCGAELSGGTRTAQVIEILQVPKSTSVDVVPQPGKGAPLGYVQLPSVATPRFTADFSPPPHVTPSGTGLTLRHIGLVQKLGFPPQTLRTHRPEGALALSRGEQSGAVANEPDAGFFTQVYLGGPESFIELEQLSPAFSAGTPASFSMALEGLQR